MSNSSDGGNGGGKQKQVKFQMTVKLDIEGRQPSDLLLRLQPFFATASAGENSGGVQSSPPPSTDSLELTLGLSLGQGRGDDRASRSHGATSNFLRSWSDEAVATSAPPPTTATTTDLEEQGWKRAAESERRQEARKKRRILMKEQRAAMQGGAASTRARNKRTREDSVSPPRERKEYSGGGTEEQEVCRFPPPLPPQVAVKVENASEGCCGGVIRPNPIHAHQRFLAAEDNIRRCSNENNITEKEKLPVPFSNNKQQLPSVQERLQLLHRISSDTNSALLRTSSLGSNVPLNPLLRTLSEGAFKNTGTSEQAAGSSSLTRNEGTSAFKSTKKEPNNVHKSFIKRFNSVNAVGDLSSSNSAIATVSNISKFTGATSQSLPLVSATGTGPNGKTVSGVLFAYKKGDVKIICACHGLQMTAKEFVEHAGGVNVANPEKCIVVNPNMITRSKSMINYKPM